MDKDEIIYVVHQDVYVENVDIKYNKIRENKLEEIAKFYSSLG